MQALSSAARVAAGAAPRLANEIKLGEVAQKWRAAGAIKAVR